jgi:dTDP-4-dehydrorhamnose 3,5-epimerase
MIHKGKIMSIVDGVTVTPLKQIFHPKGNIFHAIKSTDREYDGFGEAYFSTVIFDEIKGWKKHTKMTLNLIVPVGCIHFVVHDDRPHSKTYKMFFDIELSQQNYNRLTVEPGLWVGFKGIGTDLNLLLNVASIPHDPEEAINISLVDIKYDWGIK